MWVLFRNLHALLLTMFIFFPENDAKKLYKRIVHLQGNSTEHKYGRAGCFGLFGRKVDLVDHYEKKLENIEENVRLEQSELSLAGDVCAKTFFFCFLEENLSFVILCHFLFGSYSDN